MLKNYFKIALRNMIRNKMFSFVNVLGLAIGLACTILILLWVQDELSYDNFHKNGNNIYRVLYEWNTKPGLIATVPGLLAPEAKKVIPEVIETVRIMRRPRMVIKTIGNDKNNQTAFYEDNYYLVDPSLFKMFTLPFIKGNPETALDQGMVVTERTAMKYFGTTDVLGKRLNVNNFFDVTITGVIKDIPTNSHFNFDLFTKLEHLRYYFPGGFNWSNGIHQTYLYLAPNSDIKFVAEKLEKLNKDNNKFAAKNLKKVHLQPLRDVYLDSDVMNSTFKQGSKTYVYIFSIIALSILLIACINFINLSTAHAASRAHSIGMLKIIGANRVNLIKQMLGESILMTIAAAIVAVLFVELTLPAFNNFTGKKLILGFNNPSHILGLLLLILLTGLAAGSFPAIYFSSFKPVQAFKNKWINSRSGGLRRSLVILQFVSATILIIFTLVISEQIGFIKNQKLGFKKDNIICLPAKANVGANYLSFRNELLKERNIKDVGIKNSLTTEQVNNTRLQWEGKQTDDDLISEISEVDYNFFNTLSLKIAEGRNFSEEYPTDLSSSFIINEEAVREMGLKNPVGTRIKAWGKDGYIIGVIKDVHFKSLKEPLKPHIFHLINKYNDDVMDLFGVIFISINQGDVGNTLIAIKNTWEKFNPDYPFEYYFLDETYNNLYKSEQRLSEIFSVFTTLALFVTLLGLFGLALFITEQRTKEIGIRKVLGASIISILSLLSGNFTKWLIIANVIAWPAAWFIARKWLQSYAYHTEINLMTFIIAGTLTLLITLLTVVLIAIRTAVTNPAESLRYE